MDNTFLDEIIIEELEVYAYHGVYAKEKSDGQNFYINAVLYANLREAGNTDDLSHSTDYGVVCHFMHNWMSNHGCDLIETVAEKLSLEILKEFPNVKALNLEIRKPEAPIGLKFESVSVNVYREWTKVYLSVGSNMGDKEAYIGAAVKALEQHEKIKNVEVSTLLVTKPYGGVEQDDFVNGAIALETVMSPTELLDVLHEIEMAAGRERMIHWGPRTLDLDIVFYDKLVYEDENLIIPHVDMENRYFVLKPLAELAGNFRHPITMKTVNQMLKAVEDC